MKPKFDLFQHTADMGIRVIAPTLPELIEPAGFGLYAVIGDIKPMDGIRTVYDFSFTGPDRPTLLQHFLTELLFYFEKKSLVASSFSVEKFTDAELVVKTQMHPVDKARSVFFAEVKAITYHGLTVEEKTPSHDKCYYEAQVIVDI
jgi:SHS2 domain-containing protein